MWNVMGRGYYVLTENRPYIVGSVALVDKFGAAITLSARNSYCES